MEPFSYQQHHPYLLDSAYYPNTPIEMPLLPQQVGDITNASSCFPYYYYSEATPEVSTTDAKTYESSSSLDSGRKAPAGESEMGYSPVVAKPYGGEEVPTPQGSMEKKRRNLNGTFLSSGQSKDTRESKSRKQKKPSGGLKGMEEEKKKADDLKSTEACEEPPAGYIHVRARRGQATDSHSLAERVRREKISERMKMLQGLVPGCEKVTGKALVLDEIINYVQSLQNQVEFLSMKLASFNPILYDMAGDYDDCMNQQEKMRSMPQEMPSAIQSSHILPTAFENTTDNYPMMDSTSFLLHGQGPTNFSQDNGSFLVQVGDNRQGFLNQVEFNMCSFQ